MRRTAKYVVAEGAAKILRLEWGTAEELYELLKKEGYMWDSKTGRWLYLPEMAADEPSKLIKVRVWAELGAVEAAADTLVAALPHLGGELVDRSEIYPCRPPKQKEGRVYLTFKPKK
jgi:hypothetical protein